MFETISRNTVVTTDSLYLMERVKITGTWLIYTNQDPSDHLFRKIELSGVADSLRDAKAQVKSRY